MLLKKNLIFLTRGMIACNFKLLAFNPNNNQTPPKNRAYRENRHRITSASAFTLENILV